MDINTIREITTVLSLLAFVGIWRWAYSSRNRERFEEDGRIPFQQD
jgi:cytochrome c oxidase cbb3-type subunit IV